MSARVGIPVGFIVAAMVAWLSVPPAMARSRRAKSRPATSLNKKLVAYYGKRKNYRAVHRDVTKWYGSTRNGCVAFITSALRHVGMKVPKRVKRKGYEISLWTFTFSDYLEKERGWKRMSDVKGLRPGDIVFTTGYPDHVFMFHSWKNRAKKIARVVDNLGFLYRRPMLPPKGGKYSPFGYVLRPGRARKSR